MLKMSTKPVTDWKSKDSNDNRRKRDEETNPCLKEQELSLKCLDDNNYAKDKCELFFDNYGVCKRFWDSVRWDRRRKGIVPWLPAPEEREKVKAEYLHHVK